MPKKQNMSNAPVSEFGRRSMLLVGILRMGSATFLGDTPGVGCSNRLPQMAQTGCGWLSPP